MTQATWNGAVLAESDRCIVVAGVYYFPPDSLNRACLIESDTHTYCEVKLGQANYYHITVEGNVNKDAAWYYPVLENPKYKNIEGYAAFWKGVQVTNN